MGRVDYYELLGVDRTASTAEIKSAYRSLVKIMHPDAGGTSGTFRLLQHAYQTLTDPRARAGYDRDLGGDVTHPGTSRPSRTAPETDPEDEDYLDDEDDEDDEDTDLDDLDDLEDFDEDLDDDPDEAAEDLDEELEEVDLGAPAAAAPEATEVADATDVPGFGAAGTEAVITERERRVARPRPRPRPTIWTKRGDRQRDLGEDPEYVPAAPALDPETITWWHADGIYDRVRYLPAAGPTTGRVLAAVAGWVVLWLPLVLPIPLPLLPLIAWLLVLVVAALVVLRLVLRYLAGRRVDRAFATEFGIRRVFGQPGGESSQVAERLTAQLLARYLTKLPGVRIFHGLSWPDSVFADVDHAVLCGRRLVLIESRLWLPGHYEADETGALWRNGHPFRGGTLRLPDGVVAFREMLPELEIRGAVLLYPNRAGEITTGESPDVLAPPMSPEQFVYECGEWLAVEPATVDREQFRAVLDRVLIPTPS